MNNTSETTSISIDEDNFSKIERFHSLASGQYWRALKDIIGTPITAGMVLLIESIKWVDNLPHTIVLRTHPGIYDRYVRFVGNDGKSYQSKFTEHKFLMEDFVRDFEFEPEYKRIRELEIMEVNMEMRQHQQVLIEAQSSHEFLNKVVAEELEARVKEKSSSVNLPVATASLEYSPEVISMVSGSIAHAIGKGVTEKAVEEMKGAAKREHTIASIKANWIKKQTELITKTLEKLQPYYSEQAAASLAQTEDIMEYVGKLERGIESLELYTGKGVAVKTYKKGASASPDVKLTICQKKLFMDEELAVWSDVDSWFDFRNTEQFFETVAREPGLANQIFPTERCILVMAVNNRYLDYGDRYTNQIYNSINKNVMLAVRDGENIYSVQSPVESHLRAGRLFPTKSDQDELFTGFDGTTIKFTDLDYTDALESHENYALHYKRFLILLCGLDHRMNLFGDFYEGPKTMEFVSLKFQTDHFNLLHDDDGDGLLGHVDKPTLSEFIEDKNSVMRSGSRVICHWNTLLNADTAPGAVKRRDHHRERSYEERVYSPESDYSIHVVRKNGNDLVVDVMVSGYSYSLGRQRSFKCQVNLSAYGGSGVGFLCLDDVNADELEWYIKARYVRGDFLRYMKIFKAAVRSLREERKSEMDSRALLANCLIEGRVLESVDEAERIVNRAVSNWRAENRGAALPSATELRAGEKSLSELLSLMYQLAGNAERQLKSILEFCAGEGYQVLRVVIGQKSKLQVYVESNESERDDRVCPFSWVHKITIKSGSKGISEASRKWVVLKDSEPSETTIFEDKEKCSKWIGKEGAFKSPNHKSSILDIPDLFDVRSTMIGNKDNSVELFEQLREQFFTELRRINSVGRIVIPGIIMPFGTYVTRRKEVKYLCAICETVPALLSRQAELIGPDIAEAFRKEFAGLFKYESDAKKYLEDGLKWTLDALDENEFDFASGVFFDVRGKWFNSFAETRPLVFCSLDKWLEKTLSRMSNWGKILDTVELATCLENKSGLDSRLNIRHSGKYDPVVMISWQCVKEPGDEQISWAEIYPFDEDKKEEFERAYSKVKHDIEFTRSMRSSQYFPNREEALESIKKVMIEKPVVGIKPLLPNGSIHCLK